MPYISPVEYNEKRIHAAAVYCSDGRVGEHFDDFLQNGLCLPRYDRVALPGGPARLAEFDKPSIEKQAVLAELKFLVDAHELNRVILIQHENCAFYKHHLNLDGEALRPRQAEDLGRAAETIAQATGLKQIEAYHAQPTPKGMTFTAVELDLPAVQTASRSQTV